MATFYSGYSNQYRIRLEVNQKSQNVNNNTSVVDWALYLESGNRYFQQYLTRVNVSLDGESVHSSNVQRNVNGMNTSTLIESGSKTINHNSDGTKNLSVHASFETNSKSSFTPASALVINSSMNLTTIPRASKPTLNSDFVVFGNSITIYTNRKSENFTHTIRASLGNTSETVAQNVDTSYKWTVPSSWANLVANVSAATINIYLDTFSGSNKIGTSATSIIVGFNNSYAPTIGSISVSEADSIVKRKLNGVIYVQGQSRLKISFTASGKSGATIRSTSVTVESKTYSGNNITTDTIRGSGTVNITVKATDSRGLVSTKNSSVQVEPYTPPEITQFIVFRANSNGTFNERGTYARADYKAEVTSLNNNNKFSYTLRYKPKNSNLWQSVSISQSDYSSSSYRVVPNVSLQSSYDFSLIVEDLFDRAIAFASFGTGDITMDFKQGGQGVSFGKFSEKDKTIETAWDIDVTSKEPYVNFKPTGDYTGLRIGKQGNDNFYSINDYDGLGINIFTNGKLTHNQNIIADRGYVDREVLNVKNIANSTNNKLNSLPKIVTGQTKIYSVRPNTTDSKTISFSGFSEPPIVIAINLSGAPNLYPVSVYYVTKNNASIFAYNGYTATNNIDIAWVAIGK